MPVTLVAPAASSGRAAAASVEPVVTTGLDCDADPEMAPAAEPDVDVCDNAAVLDNIARMVAAALIFFMSLCPMFALWGAPVARRPG